MASLPESWQSNADCMLLPAFAQLWLSVCVLHCSPVGEARSEHCRHERARAAPLSPAVPQAVRTDKAALVKVVEQELVADPVAQAVLEHKEGVPLHSRLSAAEVRFLHGSATRDSMYRHIAIEGTTRQLSPPSPHVANLSRGELVSSRVRPKVTPRSGTAARWYTSSRSQ